MVVCLLIYLAVYYECGYRELLSIHKTKYGAYRAARKHHIDLFIERYNASKIYGKEFAELLNMEMEVKMSILVQYLKSSRK